MSRKSQRIKVEVEFFFDPEVPKSEDDAIYPPKPLENEAELRECVYANVVEGDFEITGTYIVDDPIV